MPVFSGPVGIDDTTNQIVDEAGWRSLLELGALLSLSLAVFNALPIPGLDGGRALFVLIEVARGGRRVSPEREGMVHFLGIALLLSSVVVITYYGVSLVGVLAQGGHGRGARRQSGPGDGHRDSLRRGGSLRRRHRVRKAFEAKEGVA